MRRPDVNPSPDPTKSNAPSLDPADRGQVLFSPAALRVYDLNVLGFHNRFVYRCPTSEQLRQYDQNVSTNHLDIGVGSGFFLDRCRFPGPNPRIWLLDINPNPLRITAQRIARYSPEKRIANVLNREQVERALSNATFDSIALNYLLHCLPGNLTTKSVVFETLRPRLNDRGVLFGSTLLCQGVNHGLLAKTLMPLYNRMGILTVLDDTLEMLEAALAKSFRHHQIRCAGSVALFVARN